MGPERIQVAEASTLSIWEACIHRSQAAVWGSEYCPQWSLVSLSPEILYLAPSRAELHAPVPEVPGLSELEPVGSRVPTAHLAAACLSG